MPICGYKNPAVLADIGQEDLVRDARIGGHVLTVESETKTGFR